MTEKKACIQAVILKQFCSECNLTENSTASDVNKEWAKKEEEKTKTKTEPQNGQKQSDRQHPKCAVRVPRPIWLPRTLVSLE